MIGPENLVLLHGWGLNQAIWSEVPAAWTVYRPDLPGHGADVGAPAPHLEAWVDAVLEGAPAQAVWLGWSFGGLLALAVARRCPERVRALILVASTPKFVATPGWAGVDVATWNDFAQALTDRYEETLQRFLALQAGLKDRMALRGLRQALVLQGAPRPAALASGLAVMAASDLRVGLKPLGLPVLVVHGRRDRIVPQAAAVWLADTLGGATVWLDEAGHAPFVSEPVRFWNAVRDFMRGIEWT